MCSTGCKFTNEVPLVLSLRIGVTPYQTRLNGIELIRNEIGGGLEIRIGGDKNMNKGEDKGF